LQLLWRAGGEYRRLELGRAFGLRGVGAEEPGRIWVPVGGKVRIKGKAFNSRGGGASEMRDLVLKTFGCVKSRFRNEGEEGEA